MKSPDYWQDPASALGRLLGPLGWIYAGATAFRLAHATPWRAPMPVICVGNLTAGGAGKTPVVREIAQLLTARGLRPAILSRGYGGRLHGPLRVDPDRHRAAEIGDEPLMLARDTPTWIAADRAEGARAIAGSLAGAIVMDDGLQNPTLAQDLRLIVADGALGFGNRRAVPAGPLRETIAAGISRADALVVVGPDLHGIDAEFSNRLPIIHARLESTNPGSLAGRGFVAFAGIGRPTKFQATLEETGARIVAFHKFPDHHPYSDAELDRLAAEAGKAQAMLLTTEKDWVRLTPRWRARIDYMAVTLRWADQGAFVRLLEEAVNGA